MSTFTWDISGGSGSGSTPTDDPKKRRRKLQNRFNQRNRRERLRQQRDTQGSGKTGSPPYRIHRWKLDESDETEVPPPTESELEPESEPRSTRTSSHASGHAHDQSIRRYNLPIRHSSASSSTDGPTSSELSLYPQRRAQCTPTDNCIEADAVMLTMIQQNLYRAGLHNTLMLKRRVMAVAPTGENQPFERVYPVSAIIPIAAGVPESLMPTPLQQAVAHYIWIEGFPCPRMRDNLIRWSSQMDWADFLYDLMGNLPDFEIRLFRESNSSSGLLSLPRRDKLVISGEEDDDFTASRHGMMVWGDPHLIENWEVTPAFLRKWGRILEGCDALIRSSNRWRESRNEGRLRIVELE